ncbi:restriction endonuclease [Streptomyces sp. NPDC054958]
MGVLRWLAAHPWIVVCTLLAAAAGVTAWRGRRSEAARWEQVKAQGLRYAVDQLDRLHHRQFEFAVRDLMHRDGCQDAQQVGGRGDNGADVKATDPYGRRWSVNCTSVGSLSGTTPNHLRSPIAQGPAPRTDRGTY